MSNSTAYVKGQKVLTPSGEGFVENIEGDEITVKLQTGESQTFADSDLEDDSDAG
jgi:lipopolysaccharide export system protein LptA